MTATTASHSNSSANIEATALTAGDTTLSALVSTPTERPPRATVIALHGTGMRAGYFDGQGYPESSLLQLGAELGYTVIAIDRPGYGSSADALPHGQSLTDQAATLATALRELPAESDIGAGLFLHAHSFGGKLALATAAYQDLPELFGLDIAGCGHRYAQHYNPADGIATLWKNSWLPLEVYPPATFRAARAIVAPIPTREQHAIADWESTFPDIAERIRIPARFTFAEHERWWEHDDRTLTNLRHQLHHSPRVVIDRQSGAGHNTSLGYTARAFHLRALAFAEECIELKKNP